MPSDKAKVENIVENMLDQFVDGAKSSESTTGPPLESDVFKSLFDFSHEALLITDSQGHVVAANPAFSKQMGWPQEDLAGFSLDRLYPDANRDPIPHRVRPLTKDVVGLPGTYEDLAVRVRSGEILRVDLSYRVLQSQGQKLHAYVLRDLTQRRQMEQDLMVKHGELRNAYVQLEKSNAELTSLQGQLVQSGKLAALGELAAGIAHEINQPLTGIKGYAQELHSIVEQAQSLDQHSDEIGSFLLEIIKNADKMSKIIQYLRVFTRQSVDELEFVDLHQVVSEVHQLVQSQLKEHGIEWKQELAEGLPKVWANPIQLEQVVANLVSNARDAIDGTNRGSGTITVRTRVSDQFVELDVLDDGVGMNQKTQQKLFNPFFTTKEVGKGMGIGMSLSFGMMNKVQGTIMVESELGKGSRLTMRIPIDFRELG